MKYIPAKTIVMHNKYPDYWFGTNYTMNIYRGCCHGCIYCDSRSDCYQIPDFDTVAAKENALWIIDKELKNKRSTGIIGTGAMSDPYNPFEEQYQLTKGALEIVNRYGFGICIITKSDLVTRDINLLKEISLHSPVCVGITITTARDDVSKGIEPGVPLSSRRFDAIAKLRENGIYAGILMTPILPYITDDEEGILAVVKNAARSGAKFIYPSLGVTLRAGQREYFYRALERLYPGIKEKYAMTYGDTYQCMSPNRKRLWELFCKACESYGIDYRMPAIIAGAKSCIVQRQVTLFDHFE